jgi:DNA-binding LacI/PurR family transcriptional regulator
MTGKSGKITLKDLAALTGVSATAISHILNDRLGHVRASQATQQKVLSAAREHGYVPRLQARSMATRRSYAIGVVCFLRPGPQDPYSASYFANALCGVEQVCKEANHHCIFVAAEAGDPDEFVEPRLMKDGSVDGVVLVGLSNPKVAAKLLRMGLPCIQIGSNIDPSLGIASVSGDVDAAVETVSRRLVQLGHRRVEFTLPGGPGAAKHLEHFRALGGRIAGLEPRTTTVPGPAMTPDHGRTLAQAALARPAHEAPTAFIMTMRAATGFVPVMAGAGRRFPRDYSLVALTSDEVETAILGPDQREVTTIVIPTLEAARRATGALFERLNATAESTRVPTQPRPIKVPCRIGEGQSCGPCPSA